MRLELTLQNILDHLNNINVEEIFPERITEDTCYTEMGQQLVLQDVRMMRLNLGRELLRFFEAMGVIDDLGMQKQPKNLIVEKLLNSAAKDPYSKKVPESVKEFEALLQQAAKYDQATYVLIVKILTMFSWRNEVLADSVLTLKNKLADVCSKVYQDMKFVMPIAPKAIAEYTEEKRRDAILFGPPPKQKKEHTVDVSDYAELGALILVQAVSTSFYTYQLALTRDDHVQAFRSFRRTVRMRKRFGITRSLQDYFISQDQTMTQKSIEQMGKSVDDMELRRFEVLLRTEQQIRNLKHKTILVD